MQYNNQIGATVAVSQVSVWPQIIISIQSDEWYNEFMQLAAWSVPEQIS